MRKPLVRVSFASLFLILLGTLPLLAQNRRVADNDRGFLAFAEEATLVNRQWWEVQLDLQNGDMNDTIDRNIVRGVVAFQPWNRVEIGGSFGLGNTDTSAGLPDGSGATDLDAWGKWFLGSDANDTRFAVGALATIPTGDDTAGLGYDQVSVGAFGSLRYQLPKWSFSAYAGARANGDAQFLGSPEIDGETSFLAGFGGLVPFNDRLTLVTELYYEGERFSMGEPDFRALVGFNVHKVGRGMIRAAFSAGLDDGAPEAQVIGGYAAEF